MRTYHGRNGAMFDANVSDSYFLDKITFGLFEKIGCYPVSAEDCKIVARILRNRATLNQWYRDVWIKEYGVKKESDESVKWMLEGAEFFENCGGTMDEDEWFDKYASDEMKEEVRREMEKEENGKND